MSLTYVETLASETVALQSDAQLLHTYEAFAYGENQLNHVEYMLVSQANNCFAVKKPVFEMLIIAELAYRELEFV